MRSATEKARRRRRSGVALMLTVLLLGAAAAIGGATVLQRSQYHLLAHAMSHEAEEVDTLILDEVGHYQEALEDLAAALATQPAPTRDVFAGMTATLSAQRLPGATGVVFVVPVRDDELASAQATWRARGATGLVLDPTGTDGMHQFVIFGRSFDGAAPVAGRDLSANTETADALRVARESRAFTVSTAHVLLRDRALPPDRQQMSFTLAVPVLDAPASSSDARLRGWVLMGVRGGDFLDRVLSDLTRGTTQVRLTDPAGAGTVIATVAGGTPMQDQRLVRDRTLVVGLHAWHLTLWPTTQRLSTSDRWGGRLILLAGLAITLLLATLVGVLAGGRNRAMDRVDQATAALREDIRRREEVERELQRLAFHDHLTGLANRGLFYDHVGQALRSRRRSGGPFAVFFIDLDGFKQVNDEYGHSAGDVVLREVAERLRACLREGDTAARFGGDEFAVLMHGLAEPGDVRVIAERIVASVQQPIDVGGREALVTASVGIALNRHGDTADDILREADMAMYTAKTTGKSRHIVAG